MVTNLTCDDEYIGETSRTFGERFKEHLKDPSTTHHHSNNTGHPTSQDNFQIIGREGHGLARSIKESIFIMVNNPTLNRIIGKFNLPHIWDRVLLNTPSLEIKKYVHNVGHAQPNTPTHLNQPNTPIQFSQLNSPMEFLQVLSMCVEPHRTNKGAAFQFSLRPVPDSLPTA